MFNVSILSDKLLENIINHNVVLHKQKVGYIAKEWAWNMAHKTKLLPIV